MDDFLKSHFSIEYLASVANSVASSLKDEGFRFIKFTSNNQVIIDQLASIEIASSQQNIEGSYHKLFRLLWNIQTNVPKLRSISSNTTLNGEYLAYFVQYSIH